jgi:hypothetical protein
MSKTTACACRSFEFGEFDGANEAAVSYTTGCKQSTTRVFAQGHDAKLVGHLVRAELAAEEIRQTRGGVVHTFPGAVAAAGAISDALAAKAQAQLDAAKARLAKAAAREASKAARKSAKAAAPEAPAPKPEPRPRAADIKVGRWIYKNASIDPTTGTATYSSKLGSLKTAEAGQYSEV